ncbi:MAG: hypothetical protein ONB33_09115 [candidate division KSB1 bacterium]|nr:hypothetical protein [candidate division KSB1 bacterium]
MKKWISKNLAGQLLIIFLSLLIVLHLFVLVKIVPPNFVWGGNIGGSLTRLYILEAISLLMTLIFLFIVIAKLRYSHWSRLNRLINIAIWIMFAYFVLNFIGNLASGVAVEKLIFAPITLLLALLTGRLAIEK